MEKLSRLEGVIEGLKEDVCELKEQMRHLNDHFTEKFMDQNARITALEKEIVKMTIFFKALTVVLSALTVSVIASLLKIIFGV